MIPFDALSPATAALASPPLAAALGLATALGALMAVVYWIGAGNRATPDIARAQIALAALMAVVMIVVGDHLSRAFGAVGILSVMRFRIKMSGATEACTLLGAVVVGMACGVGYFRVALAAALLFSLLTLALERLFRREGAEGAGASVLEP